MLLVLHLARLASILCLPLVVVEGTLSLAVPWILLLLAGVRFLGIGGSFLTMLFGLLLVFRLGLPGTVCLYALPSLWPASWTSFLDKTRSSRSTEIGRVWEICDEHLQYVPRVFLDGIWAALGAVDVSTASRVWSFAAEVSLLSAFQLASGPTPDGGFRCGRGAARFRSSVLGGPVVGKARADVADAEDGQFVYLFEGQQLA